MAKRTYEGSPKDVRQDKAGARKLGVSLKAYERTGKDKAEDKAGQSNMGRPNQRTMFGKTKGYASGGSVDDTLRPGTTYIPGSARGQPMAPDGRLRRGETMLMDPDYRAAREKEVQDLGRAKGGKVRKVVRKR